MTETYRLKTWDGYLLGWNYLTRQRLPFSYSRVQMTLTVCSDDMDKWDYKDTTEFLAMLLDADIRNSRNAAPQTV